jgi:hypothetical protein
MHDPSNIRPVSARELLAFAETAVSFVAEKEVGEDLSRADLSRLTSAAAVLKLLTDAQPVPLQQVSGPTGPYEVKRVVGDLQKIVDRNHREHGDAVVIQAAIALLTPHQRGAA